MSIKTFLQPGAAKLKEKVNCKTLSEIKWFKWVLFGVGALVVLLLAFRAGIEVGTRKASFSYRWGENYHRNFGGPREGFMGGMMGNDFVDGHGVFGKIIKIELPLLTINDQRGAEKVVLLKDDTVIRRFRDTIQPGDMKVDESVVVIGSPNDAGQIEAKLIRIMPPPPDGLVMPPPRIPGNSMMDRFWR